MMERYFIIILLILLRVYCLNNILDENKTFCNNSSNSLRIEYIKYANKYTPKYSEAWLKTSNLLNIAKRNQRILIVLMNFDGIVNRVKEMLLEYGISQVLTFLEPENEFLAIYKPGYDVVIEMSYFGAVCTYTNSSIYIKQNENHLHYRIILQSEQLNGRFSVPILNHLKYCDMFYNCTIWEYSDFHMNILKNYKLKSPILLPIMHQKLSTMNNINQLHNFRKRKLYDRPNDIVFIATMLKRRLTFHNDIAKEKFQNIVIGMENDQGKINSYYANAKICLSMHISDDYSAGEYHRLSNIIQFGCMIIFESVADILGVELMNKCGNINFQSYSQLINQSHIIIDYIHNEYNLVKNNILKNKTDSTTTTNHTLEYFQEKSFQWWTQQYHEFKYLLLDIFSNNITNRSISQTEFSHNKTEYLININSSSVT